MALSILFRPWNGSLKAFQELPKHVSRARRVVRRWADEGRGNGMIINNLKVRTKLLACASLGVAATVLVATVGLVSLDRVTQAFQTYHSQLTSLARYQAAGARIGALEVNALLALLTGDRQELDGLQEEVRYALEELHQALTVHLTSGTDSEERLLAEQVQAHAEQYGSQVLEALRMAREGHGRATIISFVAGQLSATRAAFHEGMGRLQAAAEVGILEAGSRLDTIHTGTVRLVAGILLVTLVGAGFVTAILARAITRPLAQMVAGTERLAAGDLTYAVSYQGRDEIGLAARGFNQALAGLHRLVTIVREKTAYVASSAEALARSAGEVERAAHQVATSADQIAHGGQQQAEAAQTAAGVVRTIGQTVHEVTVAVEVMVQEAEQAGHLAREGRAALEVMRERMGQMEETVVASGRAVQRLGEQSRLIGEMVDLITRVAAQTKLLALNAAIEAARAGEQGRGFSVVAGEIRQLAQESGAAAESIADLVTEIRAEVSRAVQEAEAGAQTVIDGAASLRTSEETFQTITRVLEELSAQIRTVGSSAREMAAGAQRGVESVDEIAAIAQQTAAMTQEVASAMQEQWSAVDQISNAATGLAGAAQELAGAIATFTIEEGIPEAVAD